MNPQHMIDDQRPRTLLAGRNRVQMVRMLVRRSLEGRLGEVRAWAAGGVDVHGCRRRRCARYVLLRGEGHRSVGLRKLRKRDVAALRVWRLGRHGGWMQETSETACGESLTNMCTADRHTRVFPKCRGKVCRAAQCMPAPMPMLPVASPNMISSVRDMSTIIHAP